MTFQTKNLGNLGENIAVDYLTKKGHQILDRNFRYKGYGEIDIITKKGEDLHFIEVKTRKSTSEDFLPEDNITYFKQKQLVKLAKIYLAKNKLTSADIPWQIDVIGIEINPFEKKPKIRHIEQAITDFN